MRRLLALYDHGKDKAKIRVSSERSLRHSFDYDPATDLVLTVRLRSCLQIGEIEITLSWFPCHGFGFAKSATLYLFLSS